MNPSFAPLVRALHYLPAEVNVMKISISMALVVTTLALVTGCSKKDDAKAEPPAPEGQAAQVTAQGGGAQVKVQGGSAAQPQVNVQTQGGAVKVNTTAQGTSLAANGTTVQRSGDTATVSAGGAGVKLGGPNNPRVVRTEDGRQIALQGDKVEMKTPDGRRVVVNPDGTFAAQGAAGHVNVNGANVDVSALPH